MAQPTENMLPMNPETASMFVQLGLEEVIVTLREAIQFEQSKPHPDADQIEIYRALAAMLEAQKTIAKMVI